jgi:hypothetical protein
MTSPTQARGAITKGLNPAFRIHLGGEGCMVEKEINSQKIMKKKIIYPIISIMVIVLLIMLYFYSVGSYNREMNRKLDVTIELANNSDDLFTNLTLTISNVATSPLDIIVPLGGDNAIPILECPDGSFRTITYATIGPYYQEYTLIPNDNYTCNFSFYNHWNYNHWDRIVDSKGTIIGQENYEMVSGTYQIYMVYITWKDSAGFQHPDEVATIVSNKISFTYP